MNSLIIINFLQEEKNSKYQPSKQKELINSNYNNNSKNKKIYYDHLSL